LGRSSLLQLKVGTEARAVDQGCM